MATRLFESSTESKKYTPPKFNMEPKNEGLVQMIFPFKGVIFRFHVS